MPALALAPEYTVCEWWFWGGERERGRGGEGEGEREGKREKKRKREGGGRGRGKERAVLRIFVLCNQTYNIHLCPLCSLSKRWYCCLM